MAWAEAESILSADYRSPAALADVWRAARERPPAIGIIDGHFHSVPSVWHKEILWALREGIAVFGAASMGALRAAELDVFGMIGIGRIYEAYAAGELEDDDEVALMHAGAEHGFRSMSEAMVNIRATLTRAVRENVLSPKAASTVGKVAKDLFYPERAWPHILERARSIGIENAELRSFREWLPGNFVNQKRADAIAMLQAMRDPIATPSPDFNFEETVLWRALLEREASDDRAVLGELKLHLKLFDEVSREVETSGATVLDSLRSRGAYEDLLEHARRKDILVSRSVERDVPEREPLIRWFFQERLGGWPDDVSAFLHARGWVNEEILAGIAEREFRASAKVLAK
jgi:hypothetical protein